MLTAKRGLNMFAFKQPFGFGGFSQALLASSAQLETLCVASCAFLDQCWSLIRDLPSHPLKTVTRLEIPFLTVHHFENILNVCPSLNLISSVCFIYLRYLQSPLAVVRAFLDRCSRIARDVRQLVMGRPCTPVQSRNCFLELLEEQSAQLTDCVVLLRLDLQLPEIVVSRQNAVIYIRKGPLPL